MNLHEYQAKALLQEYGIPIPPGGIAASAAEAEARATHMVSKAIETGDVQAINYFVAQKYVDAIKEMATTQNDKIIFMPLEASSLIGALGGIGELAKATFGNKDGAKS